MTPFAAPIRRRRDGSYAVRLDPTVRAVLRSASQQMVPLLASDDVATRRLFPPAYVGGERAAEEREYRKLVDNALQSHHRHALAVLADTATADTLSSGEINAWLSAVGSMRLVLGTRLDVSEDTTPPPTNDPAAPEHALYDLLGALQEAIISVLASELPREGEPGRAL